MSRKPNSMYRRVVGLPYTRREYMGGIPNLRIANFNAGNTKGDFPIELVIVSKEMCQVRHTALEAARITANRVMTKTGVMNYHLKIMIYPHNVLRENKQATGAGADRVSQGMRSAFGKNVSLAARVYPGTRLIMIRTTKGSFGKAKEALRKASMKLPTPVRLVIQKGKDIIEA
jgi:large subunit ribosomal protein L10e